MSGWAQVVVVIVTLGSMFVAGFGFLWRALAAVEERVGHRLDRLDDRVVSVDRRLSRIESRLSISVPDDES